MYCYKCGKHLPDKSTFCAFCGTNQISEPIVSAEIDAPYRSKIAIEGKSQRKAKGKQSIIIALVTLAVVGVLIPTVILPAVQKGIATSENPGQDETHAFENDEAEANPAGKLDENSESTSTDSLAKETADSDTIPINNLPSEIASAYLKLLQKDEEMIKLAETDRLWMTSATVLIADINRDSIPELCYFAVDNKDSYYMEWDKTYYYPYAHFYIWTYEGNAPKQLLSIEHYEDGVQNGYFITSDKTLYIYSSVGQGGSTDSHIKCVFRDGRWIPLEVLFSSYEAEYETDYFFADKVSPGFFDDGARLVSVESQSKISKEEYMQRLNSIIQNASNTLFIDRYDGSGRVDKKAYDDPSIQYMPASAPIAVSYDEAIAQLADVLGLDITITPEPAKDTIPAISSEQAKELESMVLDGKNRYYSRQELTPLGAYELSILRNGMYALSGKQFQTNQSVIDFFSSCSWYQPDTTDDKIVKSRFNRHQNSNLELITDIEREKGLR